MFMIDRCLIIDLRQLLALLSVTQAILIAPDSLHLSVAIQNLILDFGFGCGGSFAMLKVDEKKSKQGWIDFYKTGCLFDIFLTMRSQPNKMEELGAHWSFICHHCRDHFPYHHLQKPPKYVAFSCSFGGKSTWHTTQFVSIQMQDCLLITSS